MLEQPILSIIPDSHPLRFSTTEMEPMEVEKSIQNGVTKSSGVTTIESNS